MKIPQRYRRRTSTIASLALLLIAVAPLSAYREGPNPPSSVRSQYNAYDPNLSDNFNGGVDWSKWTRRQTNIASKGSLATWQLGTVNGGWMRLYGKRINGNWVGNGFASKPSKIYNTGFYVARWKFNGPSNNKTIYHPSIWSANWNNGVDSATIPTGSNWLELDFMEYESWPHYSPASHLVPRVNGQIPSGNTRPRMVDGGVITSFSDQIWGVEYHKNYIRTWKYANGTWSQVGRTVWSSGQTNWAINKYSYKCRKKMYWILSNITPDWQRRPAALQNNSTADTAFYINYFEYHPGKSKI
ncbi:hypothetical protein [Coraliomargarita akajimensis]|uniref:GH16 domain-containing protein n=1 Tax=Coraliomargarita akajimensis (strain DSM 45221 / IAM 15411 / JCM 23193 / KCTC 12865 / 04OKA010-24) TaxID=583355 RepID=D5EQ80_CORAD|nr:hypothetical protein [Coraliomargarita akajimensis]ADE53848.1 hypothetical protein Caka_0824 [Coraliomargarita akajimensis DSM 45221]